MTYTKQAWANGFAGGTPIDAGRLQHIEDGIAANDAAAAQAAADARTRTTGIPLFQDTINYRVPNLTASSNTAPVDVRPALQAHLNSLPVGSVCQIPNCAAPNQYYLGSTLTVPAGVTLVGAHVRGASPTAQGGSYLRAMPGGTFTNNTLIVLGGSRSQLSHMMINGDAVVDTVVDAGSASDAWHEFCTITGGNLYAWKGNTADRNHLTTMELNGNVLLGLDVSVVGGRQGNGYIQMNASGQMDNFHMNASGTGNGNLILAAGGIRIGGTCVIDTWSATGALGGIYVAASADNNPISISCDFKRTSNSTAPFITIASTAARGIIHGCTESQLSTVTPGAVPVAVQFGSTANAARWGVRGNMFPNSTALFDFAPGSAGGNYNNGAWT